MLVCVLCYHGENIDELGVRKYLTNCISLRCEQLLEENLKGKILKNC